MKAEEQRDKDIVEALENLKKGLLYPSEVEASMISICKNYARQKCSEQRILCAKPVYAFIDNEDKVIYSSDVLNAPEPEFS